MTTRRIKTFGLSSPRSPLYPPLSLSVRSTASDPISTMTTSVTRRPLRPYPPLPRLPPTPTTATTNATTTTTTRTTTTSVWCRRGHPRRCYDDRFARSRDARCRADSWCARDPLVTATTRRPRPRPASTTTTTSKTRCRRRPTTSSYKPKLYEATSGTDPNGATWPPCPPRNPLLPLASASPRLTPRPFSLLSDGLEFDKIAFASIFLGECSFVDLPPLAFVSYPLLPIFRSWPNSAKKKKWTPI